ncbi:hypothetical protein MBLNU459_g3336t1 [Dothideomycetes sp. NU459]
MDQTQPGESPLDQLEAQVNLVLQHTGRIFANTARTGRDKAGVNHAGKLRQVFSGAAHSFHDALDVLEGELALARSVMRRDLAVFRAAQIEQTSKQNSDAAVVDESKADAAADGSLVVENDIDVTMTENSPRISGQHEASPHHSIHDAVETEASPPAVDVSARPEDVESRDVDVTEEPKPRSPLQLSIPSEAHVESEQSGDNAATGTYSNFDFESLFNDPNSAAPGSNASPDAPQGQPVEEDLAAASGPAPEPVRETEPKSTASETVDLTTAASAAAAAASTTAAEASAEPADGGNDDDQFDFTNLADFGDDTNMADTDNISSLLPGLESYANADNSGEQQANDTFNIFDAAGGPDFGAVVTSGDVGNAATQTADQTSQKQGGQIGEDGRDTTFDDIMDFNNFDLGDFGGDGGDGESKFDADFFNI